MQLVFWDFDGVIKDSVEVKSVAFERLFLSYGKDVAGKVRLHHEAHGGVSRYEKMPIYLGWADEPVNAARVHEFCQRFSELARQAVIDSAWVPGVREYLQAQHERQHFVLISATPQEEMEQILLALEIYPFFREVHGAPKSKTLAIRDVLQRMGCPSDKVLVVGDSETDLAAAEANRVMFLLRRTALNQFLQERHRGPMCDNFIHE